MKARFCDFFGVEPVGDALQEILYAIEMTNIREQMRGWPEPVQVVQECGTWFVIVNDAWFRDVIGDSRFVGKYDWS